MSFNDLSDFLLMPDILLSEYTIGYLFANWKYYLYFMDNEIKAEIK